MTDSVVPGTGLVDIIEKALYGYVKPYQAVHVARKVVRVITANREAALRELGMEHVGWRSPNGSLWLDFAAGHSDDRRVWAEPPRQPAPSTEREK